MKVAIWIGDTREVLYDSITDEIVFRDIGAENPTVIRVAYMDVMRARLKARHDSVPVPYPISQTRVRRKS